MENVICDVSCTETLCMRITYNAISFFQLFLSLKRYQIFGYFLSELPDAANRSTFVEALPVIWAVQGKYNSIKLSFRLCCFNVI